MNSIVSHVGQQRVFVIDYPVGAVGVRMVLQSFLQHEAVFCGMAPNFRAAFDPISKLNPPPDLVIAEIVTSSGGVSLEGLKNLHTIQPDLKVLIYSTQDEKVFALRVISAGAVGFVSKDASFDFFVKQIKSALAGKCTVSEEVNNRLLENMTGRRVLEVGRSPVEVLSDRELEIFNMLGRGMGTRPIAEMLHLSVKTVESHRAHIKEKLNLKNANELTHLAITYVNIR